MITENLFDCDGVNNNVIWLEARRVVLVDQIVTRNMILSYGRGLRSSTAARMGLDTPPCQATYSTAPWSFRETRAGREGGDPHTFVADNAGP
jgi:hypothetical protein